MQSGNIYSLSNKYWTIHMYILAEVVSLLTNIGQNSMYNLAEVRYLSNKYWTMYMYNLAAVGTVVESCHHCVLDFLKIIYIILLFGIV